MLNGDSNAKAQRQIATFTNNYRQAKALGYNVNVMGLTAHSHPEYGSLDSGYLVFKQVLREFSFAKGR
jgi:hypothetical protein